MKKNERDLRNKDLTELVFILDESGSMFPLKADTVGGFNGMLEKQKKADGRCLVTTVFFSSEEKRVHDREEITEIKPLTERDYCPGGCTALYDAIGRTVEHIRSIHRYARPEDVPARTLVVITTDGMENASRHYRALDIKRLVRARQEDGWEFLFLGANMDAIAAAGNIGIREDYAVTFRCDQKGTAMNFEAMEAAVDSVRCAKPLTRAWKKEIEERGDR